MIYQVRDGQTLFDILLNTYNSFELAGKLLQDNGLTWDYDFANSSGLQLTWDATLKVSSPVTIISKPKAEPSPISYITAVEGQSIYDLVLMTYGDLSYVFKFITDNKISSINDTDLRGKTYFWSNTLNQNIQFLNWLTANKKVIVSVGGETTTRLVWDGVYLIWDGSSLLTWD
jgi:hypothetical protein